MFCSNLLKPKACLAGLLLVALCCASLPCVSVQAQVAKTPAPGKRPATVAPAQVLKVKPSVPRPDKMSADLFAQFGKLGVGKRSGLRVVCQFNAPPGAGVNAIYQRANVQVNYSLQNFNYVVATMPASVVGELSAFPEISFISPDREVRNLGHVSATTGADLVRSAAVPGLDGTGIGIAVLDSGIKHSHKSFRDGRTASSNVRVVTEQDFVSYNGQTDDAYGHGTHVASLAAGNGRISNAAYIGIAPNADIINLRVLDDAGTGRVSNLLNALDWVLTNHARYNIRVVNMSLGVPAIDSYRNDPVCNAVRRLVDAGIVVVTAAGNNGRDSNGNKIYGEIHSPGIEPSALTVGAVNTFGTDARADDAVAAYSSRGPTRSAWLDAAGGRHYDNLLKPDLVAPGNRLVGAYADGNFLATTYHLRAFVSADDSREMMTLSGTSMATPIVAVAVAHAASQSQLDAEHGQGALDVFGAAARRFQHVRAGRRRVEHRRRGQTCQTCAHRPDE
jgi:subtilisin family serine protease